MKRQICLTIDIEVLKKLQKENINISALVEKLLIDLSTETALLNRVKDLEEQLKNAKNKNKVVIV